MTPLNIIRKIGKILRGGAGRKEILLGTLFGVLIGFNPGINFALLVTFLFALLLNANFSFVVLGAAIGKLLSLTAAAISFNIGFAVIHEMGLENLFRSLCNAPLTALMDLNVYAMVGSFPLALAAGIILGAVFSSAVVSIRKKMLEADQHEIIGKAFGNKVSRLLLRLAFGKSKLSLEDEIPKKAPLLRKSGLILVASVVVIALVFEFFLLDSILRRGIESGIASRTGAEVNVAKAHLSLAGGEISIEGLQVTDPDKPTHNMIEIDRLVADINIGELLSRNYEIDLLAGSMLKRDVPRQSPGAVYEYPEAEETEEQAVPPDEQAGKPLDEYFASAGKWKQYGQKAYDYLKQRKENAESASRGEKPKTSKEAALASAKQRGYLEASADLYADRPTWTVQKLRIESVRLDSEIPEQILEATELSSHPELNGKPTKLTLTPIDGSDPTVRIVLRFDDPSAPHALMINQADIPLEGAIKTSESFPVDVSGGMADLHLAGRFSTDDVNLPFALLLHNLKASVPEGEQVMGMDAETATEVLSSMEQLEIEGTVEGALLAPRISIDYDKLTANMKEALLAAGKKQLSERANAEMDKAKQELKEQAGQELNKALGGEESGSVEEKAKDALKKLF